MIDDDRLKCLYFKMKEWKNKTYFNVWSSQILSIQITHCFNSMITIFKMNKGIIFYFFDSFHLSVLLELFLIIIKKNQLKIFKNRLKKCHTFSFSSLVSWVKFLTYNTLTLLIVPSSGSSCGSAQSTMISHPQTCFLFWKKNEKKNCKYLLFSLFVGFMVKIIKKISKICDTLMRPVPNLLFANEAALWESYSRKQKPRFFFLSSGEL